MAKFTFHLFSEKAKHFVGMTIPATAGPTAS
jgi:hypothetical protein